MSLLSRLRKRGPRLTDPDPAVRRQALAALTAPLSQEQHATLGKLAATDDDIQVRRLAIALCEDDTLLGSLLDDEAVAEPAASRLAGLLGSGAVSAHRNHPRVIGARLAAGEQLDPDQLTDTPADTLIEIVIACRGEQRARLLDHPEFRLATLLGSLERRTRDKDKSLNRFARERLEEIRFLRARAADHAQRMEELLAALEKDAASQAPQPGFRDRHAKLSKEADDVLEALRGETDALIAHGETPIDVSALAGRLASVPALEPLPPAAAVAAPSAEPVATRPPSEDFTELTDGFRALAADLRQVNDFASLSSLRQVLTERWLVAADQHPPTDTQHKVFERVSQEFRELAEANSQLEDHPLPSRVDGDLPERIPKDGPAADAFWQQVSKHRRWLRQCEKALAKLRWPAWAPEPTAMTAARETMTVVQARLSSFEQQVQELLGAVEEHLARLGASIEEGASNTAQTLLSQTRQLVRRLPRDVGEQPGKLLNHEAARLAELKDWRNFATTPKREALCSSMAALVASPLPPADQAQRIKDLRQQWNELGPVNQAADRPLAEQFNSQAEQAFEPCRAYFAEQAQVRADNLRARENICAQLRSYLDASSWPGGDIKAAENILRTAREEWRRFHPVDRKPGKPLEDRFEALQAELHGHIKAAWEQNLASKRAIVEEARALLDDAVAVPDKVNGAKTLQQRWRSVGSTPRRPDQLLWKEFRGICDDIFGALDSARQAADQAIKDDEASARHVLEAFADSLEKEAPNAAALRDFQQRFQDVSRLPDRLQRPLDRRFAELEQECRALLKAQANAARINNLRRLAEQDQEMSRQEIAHRSGAPLEFEAPAAEFAARWSKVDNDVPLDALRRMTIEAEIAAEMDSAAEDRELRLTIQVELMNTGLGKRALESDPQALAKNWCALGPKSIEIEPLRERFFAALEALAS